MIGDGGHARVCRECDVTGNIIAIGDNRVRKRIDLERAGEVWGRATHLSATVSTSAIIGAGAMIMAGAVIQTGA